MRYVYVMQLIGTDFYKIGSSSDPERRRLELEREMGRRLIVYLFREAQFAYLIEHELHIAYFLNYDRANSFSCPSEWFKFSPDEILKVATEIDKRIIHGKEKRRERLINSDQ